MPSLSVLSYNIHHGEGMDGEIDLGRIAAVIRSVNPDLVALQEVDQRTERTNGVDQAAVLSRMTGMEAVFGASFPYQGGAYGNAVLSRLRAKASSVELFRGSEEREQRSFLAVDLNWTATDEPLYLLATHFDFDRDPQDRLASVDAINRWVASRPAGRALLAGDLNAVLGGDALNALAREWTVADEGAPTPTVPVNDPERQIDFILYRPSARWRVEEVRVLTNESVASDHLPILVRLTSA